MPLFSRIAKEYAAYDAWREQVIKASRDVLRASKQIIFLCHEGKLAEAGAQLARTTKLAASLEKQFNRSVSGKRFSADQEGSWAAACEEYLEAWFFYHILRDKKIIEPKGIDAPAEVLLGALADCTGEIVRNAMMRGAERDVKTVRQYRSLVISVVAFMTPLYLTGYARQKFDAAKKNLKAIEQILYDIAIRTT